MSVKKIFESLRKVNEDEKFKKFYGIDIVPGMDGEVMGVYKGPNTKIKELHLVDFYDDFMDNLDIDVDEIDKRNVLEWFQENYPEVVEHYNIHGDFVKFGMNDEYEAGYIVFSGDDREFKFDPTEYLDFDAYDEDDSEGLAFDWNKGKKLPEVLPSECEGWHAISTDN